MADIQKLNVNSTTYDISVPFSKVTGSLGGPIYFGSITTEDTYKPILSFNSTYPNYGISYNNSSTDKMAFSASGNSNSKDADLCINGNGDGTVTVRGKTIYHTGNLTKVSQLTNDAGYKTTDTNTWRPITDSVSTTDSTISASATAVKTAYDKANHSHPYLPTAGGTMTGSITISQPSSNRRVGIIGTYDPNRAAAIWAMGASYQIPTDGLSFGSLYGAAYAYYGSGYTFGAGKSGGHSFVWCQAGSPTSALGDNVWTSGGFIKNGSSDSYVLLGGGGHKAESSLSVNYATSAGSASSAGSVAWGNVSGKPSFFTPSRYGTLGSSSYYKIKINSSTSWMLAFNVRVYQGYSFHDIRFSGYNYGGSYWYSPVASLTDGDSAITVYFGYDSAWNLWVAIPGSSYTGIEITNVCNGYTQVIGPDLSSLFTISAVSSLSGTVQSTQTIQPPSRAGHTHSQYLTELPSHTHSYLPLGGGTLTGLLTTTSGNSHNGIKIGSNYINAINGDLIFQNNGAIRFGGDSWDYNVWAGLKYVHSSKSIYLGLADGTQFTANSAQSGGKMYFPGISGLYAAAYYQSSDERLKTFYDPIKVDLDKLKKLRKNYFKFNDNDELQIGVSAQEVREIYPEIVSENEEGYLSVAYDKLSVIALSAIDKLDDDIKELKQENNDLKDQLNAIKNILKEKGIL